MCLIHLYLFCNTIRLFFQISLKISLTVLCHSKNVTFLYFFGQLVIMEDRKEAQ